MSSRKSSRQSSCVCCGVQVKHSMASPNFSSISMSSWTSACAKSVVDTLKLDEQSMRKLETGVFCSQCLENVREIDYLVRTIDKLQSRLSHFQNKLISVSKGVLLQCGPGQSTLEAAVAGSEFEDDILVPIQITSSSLQILALLKFDEEHDDDFMDLDDATIQDLAPSSLDPKTNSPWKEEVDDELESSPSFSLDSDVSGSWTPPILLRQKLINKRKRMKSIQKRGRHPVYRINCTFEGCTFEYSAKKEKSYQVHLRKVHGEEKVMDAGNPIPIPEGKVCSYGRCTKEGCELSPEVKEALRAEFLKKDYKEQNEFLSGCVDIEEPKVHRVRNSRKKHTYKYWIPHQGSRKPVCRKTLIDVFPFSKERIRVVTEKVEKGEGFSDRRGKHANRGFACTEFSHPPNFQAEKGQDLACPHCSDHFHLKCCLRRHVRENHSVPAARPQKRKCLACGFVFAPGKESEFEVHSELHQHRETEGQKFSCVLPNCLKIYVNSIDLKKHVISDHEVEGLMRCELCNSTFTRVYGLKEHLKEFHYEVNPFKCRSCRYNGTSQEDLNSHKLSHTLKKYTCAECGASFKFVAGLKTHVILHHKPADTWPYQCTFKGCGRRFVRGSVLKSHEESHQKVRSYMCEKCPKAYRTMNVMRNHMMLKHK